MTNTIAGPPPQPTHTTVDWLVAVIAAGALGILLAMALMTTPKPSSSAAPAIVVRGTARCWEYGQEVLVAEGRVTLPASQNVLRIEEPQGLTLWIANGCLVEQVKR